MESLRDERQMTVSVHEAVGGGDDEEYEKAA
jgi:hypothetical protein